MRLKSGLLYFFYIYIDEFAVFDTMTDGVARHIIRKNSKSIYFIDVMYQLSDGFALQLDENVNQKTKGNTRGAPAVCSLNREGTKR